MLASIFRMIVGHRREEHHTVHPRYRDVNSYIFLVVSFCLLCLNTDFCTYYHGTLDRLILFWIFCRQSNATVYLFTVPFLASEAASVVTPWQLACINNFPWIAIDSVFRTAEGGAPFNGKIELKITDWCCHRLIWAISFGLNLSFKVPLWARCTTKSFLDFALLYAIFRKWMFCLYAGIFKCVS